MRILILIMACCGVAHAQHPLAAPRVTSLTNPSVKFTTTDKHHAVLKRNGITAIIIDNAAGDSDALSTHRAGYNGVAVLNHSSQKKNLFVPTYAGLNFEHIHDGTTAVNKEKFEPRKWPMQLRVINDHTVELYQSPTPNWKLESCGRYSILEDGTLEYTFECIPREDLFKNGYIGLFWASYINSPEDKAINFIGREMKDSTIPPRWIRAITPKHGVNSTHPPVGYGPHPNVAADFPLTLVNHPSSYVHTTPFYYGVNGKMAFGQMFRSRDQIWLAQSPTGGGAVNPAWDFQWFIPNCKVGEAYGFVMRAAYVPAGSTEQIHKVVSKHLSTLNP